MKTLDELTQLWKDAKYHENLWSEARINIESEIYELERDNLPDKGTYTTPTGMKITTGYTEKWNADILAATTWDANVPFPFKVEYKPIAKDISYIRENMPHAYQAISEALTITPKKPNFSVKD